MEDEEGRGVGFSASASADHPEYVIVSIIEQGATLDEMRDSAADSVHDALFKARRIGNASRRGQSRSRRAEVGFGLGRAEA